MESLTRPDSESLAHPDHKKRIPFHENTPLGFGIRGHGGDMGPWGHGTTGLGTEGARN